MKDCYGKQLRRSIFFLGLKKKLSLKFDKKKDKVINNSKKSIDFERVRRSGRTITNQTN